MTTPDINDDEKPTEPLRPTADQCCRGGCALCVFDLHELEVARYRSALQAWEHRRLK